MARQEQSPCPTVRLTSAANPSSLVGEIAGVTPDLIRGRNDGTRSGRNDGNRMAFGGRRHCGLDPQSPLRICRERSWPFRLRITARAGRHYGLDPQRTYQRL